MTITATDGAGSVPPTAFRSDALDSHRRLNRLRRLLRRSLRSLAAGAGEAMPTLAPAVVRELSAIHIFALHMAKHPDMPAEHRARYLAEICRSCEEALEELS